MKEIFEGKHVVVRERDGWEFVERKKAKEAVAIIAVVDGRLVLTEQYRRPVDARVLDLPAGLIEKHSAEKTAKQELEEETGFTCDGVTLLASGPTSPGITSEIVHFYRAKNARQEGKGGGVGDEEITVHTLPLRGAEQWLRMQAEEGILVDLKVWTGLYFATQST